MKIGFSSAVCPDWDLETIITRAAEAGFDGVELRGLKGHDRLHLIPELTEEAQRVRSLLGDKQIDLVCLGGSTSLDSKQERVVEAQKAEIVKLVELASRLGCPYVRLPMGRVQPWDNRRKALARIAAAVASLVPTAVAANVTILVENTGDFLSSVDLWFVVDAANHPAVQCCWNQCHALTRRERPTNSIPRLGQKLGLVHVSDAEFDQVHARARYQPLGQGEAEVAHQIELLRGIGYDGYLVYDGLENPLEGLPEPEALLPEVARFLRGQLETKQEPLSAYKGDKRPTKFAPRNPSITGKV